MAYFFKILLSLVAELIFDTPDEYNYNSPRFNVRKVIVMTWLIISFMVNVWLLFKFVEVTNLYLDCRTVCPAHVTMMPEKPK